MVLRAEKTHTNNPGWTRHGKIRISSAVASRPSVFASDRSSRGRVQSDRRVKSQFEERTAERRKLTGAAVARRARSCAITAAP